MTLKPMPVPHCPHIVRLEYAIAAARQIHVANPTMRIEIVTNCVNDRAVLLAKIGIEKDVIVDQPSRRRRDDPIRPVDDETFSLFNPVGANARPSPNVERCNPRPAYFNRGSRISTHRYL